MTIGDLYVMFNHIDEPNVYRYKRDASQLSFASVKKDTIVMLLEVYQQYSWKVLLPNGITGWVIMTHSFKKI